MGTLQARNVCRQLLKAVEKHIGKDGKNGHFRDFVIDEFKKNAKLCDDVTAKKKLSLAHNYTLLLNKVQHHKELLFSYNIAVDRSDELRQTINKSAASVGLQLPEVYQP